MKGSQNAWLPNKNIIRGGDVNMRTVVIAIGVCLTLTGFCYAQVVPAPTSRVETRIRPQALGNALKELAQSRNLQVLYLTAEVKGLRSSGVRGDLTVDEALRRMLRGTGLKYRYVDSDAVSIVSANSQTSAVPHAPATETDKRKIGPTGEKTSESVRKHKSDPEVSTKSRDKSAKKNKVPTLQEVVVTGTHISGGPPPSAPMITITRQDIEDSGYQSVEQVMDSLPENFAAVGSGQTFDIATQSNAGNDANGATVDLNGLGFDTTLILVNGHRLPPSGANGAFTDISVIPLSAIERIDVMTAGASAIYGSDAIGGVVNYILKRHEEGAHTSVEYGSVTKGGLKDYRVSQSVGGSWHGGTGLLSYEYHRQTPLSGEDRPFSSFAHAYEPTDLLPGFTQNNVYGTASQSLGNDTKIESDILYEHRNARSSLMDTRITRVDSSSDEFSGGAQISHQTSDMWTVTGRLDYGANDATSGDSLGTDHDASGLLSLDIGITGPLLRLPSGPVKAAFGLQGQRQTFSFRLSGPEASNSVPIRKSRIVYAAYAEARIPLWEGPGNDKSPAATLDLAGRYEHYTDFGSTLNPMAGLAWEPIAPLRIRGTIGTSFRAPNFNELYGSDQAYLVNSPVANHPAVSPLLFLDGSNPNLKPETATEWTAGIDVLPNDSRMTASATYFHIHFKDEIASPNIPLLAALDQGGIYDPFIRSNPPSLELTSIVDTTNEYLNLTQFPGFGPQRPLSAAVAIADNRLQNIGALNESGIDVSFSRRGHLNEATYRLGAESTYLFTYEDVYLPGATPQKLLNTFEHPVNFRARVTASLGLHRLAISGAVNYTNHYNNAAGFLPPRIASWLTADMGVTYRLPRWRYLTQSSVQLSCTNCLNRLPPYTGTGLYVFAFDPLNASPLGRFISLMLRANW